MKNDFITATVRNISERLDKISPPVRIAAGLSGMMTALATTIGTSPIINKPVGMAIYAAGMAVGIAGMAVTAHVTAQPQRERARSKDLH